MQKQSSRFHSGLFIYLGVIPLLVVLVQMGAVPQAGPSNVAALQPSGPVVTSASDCAAYENYPGAEPPGYAQYCLKDHNLPAVLDAPMDPTDIGFAHDLRNTDNLVNFTLNNFPGQTVLSQNTQSIFGYDFDGTATVLYALDNDAQQLGTMNQNTGVFTLIGSSIPNAGHTWTGLTVNPVNGTIYASSTDGTTSTLYTLNPTTGAASIVGNITGLALVIDIAMNPAGELYGHDIGTDSIYQINPSTGAPTLIGLTGYNANFAQGMDFDNSDGTLYIFLYLGGGSNIYGTVNLSTGAVTPLATDNPLGEFEGATQTIAPEIILDQPPNQSNGLFSDPHCENCATGQQAMADNFTLSGLATIEEITVWGGYFPNNLPNTIDDFTVIFREDAGGMPGAVIASEAEVPYTRSQTGVILFGVDEYRYTLTLDLPITLETGTYWLEIFNDTIASLDSYFWEVGDLDPVHGIAGTAFSQQVAGGIWNPDINDALATYIPAATLPAPVHDLFGNATTVSALPYTDEVNVVAATIAGNDPVFTCGSLDTGGATVWYHYTAVTNTPLIVHTSGSRYDTMLAVWQGTAGSLTNVACNDDIASGNLQSEIKFTAQAGQDYYFEVAAYGSNSAGNLMFSMVETDEWSYRGPERPSPSVNELTIDSQSPNTVYAATTEGVYKSTNGGDDWTAKLDGLGTFGGLEVTNLVIHPTNHQTLYISTWGDGVYRSTDGGENWVLLPSPVTAQVFNQPNEEMEWIHAGGSAMIAPDPISLSTEVGTQVADLGSGQPVLDKQNMPPKSYLPVLESDTPNVPRPINWTPARTLAIHPTNPNRLIMGVSDNYGFFISEDAGSNWTPLIMPSATITSGRAVAFAPSSPNVVYASTGDWGANGGIFRSTNGGQTWTMTAGSGSVASAVTHFAIDPDDPNHVLATTVGEHVVVTFNGGVSWNPSDTGISSEGRMYNIEISPANPDIVYATGYLWIWKSVNGGANWAIADTSYLDLASFGLALHPTNTNVAYVGAHQLYIDTEYYRGGVYKTTNGGNTFSQQVNGMEKTYVLDMEPDPANPMIAYAGTWGSGIYKTTDGGYTWVQANAGLDLPFVYSLQATEGPAGTILYAGTFYSDRGLFVSYNQGASWQALPYITLSWQARSIFDIESFDGSSNNLVMATGNGLYQSIDGGMNWSRGQLGGADTVNIILDIETVPALSNRLLAATYGDGIYYTSDNGLNWSMSSGEPSTIVLGLSASPDAASGTHVYAANAGVSAFTGGTAVAGLSRSTDGGVTWQAVDDDALVGLSFRSVDHALAGTGDIFAGSVGQGMWVSPDYSNLWFHMTQGFTPIRVRSVDADFQWPDKVFVGTDGQGAWWFHMGQSPTLYTLNLPVVARP